MNVLDEWLDNACAALELPALSGDDRQAVLDLARDVAHGVVRPAAPLTAFLLGVAVGRGADPREASLKLTRLIPEPQAHSS